MTPEDKIRKLDQAVAFLTAQIAGLIPVRVADGGGGTGGATSVTKFGIVRQAAGASGRRAENDGLFPGNLGKCQLLSPTMIALPPEAGQSLEDSYIEIASLHLVPCRVGAIVLLHSEKEIRQATRWPTGQSQPNTIEAVVWAQLIHATDELYELAGHAPEKVLWLPTGATSGDGIRWDGGACPP